MQILLRTWQEHWFAMGSCGSSIIPHNSPHNRISNFPAHFLSKIMQWYLPFLHPTRKPTNLRVDISFKLPKVLSFQIWRSTNFARLKKQVACFYNKLGVQKQFRNSSFYSAIWLVLLYCSNNNGSSYIPSLTASFFVSVFVHVVWTHTAIGSAVISQEGFERELCLPGWLSSTIFRGPTPSENDRHLCMWHQRIMRDSCQKKEHNTALTKSSRPQFPRSTHRTPRTMTPLLATKSGFHFLTSAPLRSPSKKCWRR